jgi:hypothetical protein
MRKAAGLDYDYVWIMDDDCIPSETAFGKLYEYASAHEGEYGFLCSKVLWKDGSISIINVPRETLVRNVKDMNRDIIRVTMASFASLFIPVSVIRDVGLPYREFFIWTDDWEYTRRISSKYPCMLGDSTFWVLADEKHIMIPVLPGDSVVVYANSGQNAYYGILNSFQIPQILETVRYSTATGFTGKRRKRRKGRKGRQPTTHWRAMSLWSLKSL